MNSNRNKKPPKWEEMTREQIRDAIIKKRECEAKAQRVVESFLETIVQESCFVDSLPLISQSHYEDVVEERVIVKLCGYPICKNNLPTDVPKQQYKISNKNNKVYDLTNRKNFCSNYCYRASNHIKNQIPTSPLWYRETKDMPPFRLLPVDIPGSPGDLIDLSLTESIRSTIKIKDEPFTSISDFAQASLNDVNQEINVEVDNRTTVNENESKNISETNTQHTNNRLVDKVLQDTEKSVIINNASATSESLETIVQSSNITESTPNKGNVELRQPQIDANSKKAIVNKLIKSNPLSILGDIVEKTIKEPIKPPKSNASKAAPKKIVNEKAKPQTIEPIIQVERCISEWFNLETLIFLFGEAKVKEMVSDKGDCIKEYLNNMANGLYYSATSYDNYQSLCRKLRLLELEDMRYDKGLLKSKPTKPLVDYESLKEDSIEMELKVRAYYGGETVIVKDDVSPASHERTEGDDNVRNVPLADRTSQNALRRKIVLTALNKVLADLAQSLGITSRDIGNNVRSLINTFDLKATNILFKHTQWYLIGIIMIKLLSIRDEQLAVLLEETIANKHMQLILLSYGQDGGYLDRLVMWLTDIDRLLNTTDRSLTIT